MPAIGLSETGGIGTVPTPYIALLGGIMRIPGGAIPGGAIPGGAIPGAIPGGNTMPAGAMTGVMPGGLTLMMLKGELKDLAPGMAPGMAPYSYNGLPDIVSHRLGGAKPGAL